MPIKKHNNDLPTPYKRPPIEYLNEKQIEDLTKVFMDYYDKATPKFRRIRGRHWIAFLFLRYTGARLNEVLSINDSTDIDFRNYEVKLITLKQKQNRFRIVPLPSKAISELTVYLTQYPYLKGMVFASIDQRAFRRIFVGLCKKADIPEKLSHPHILRHTRAIEMLKAGVPITAVQDILGHSSITTTAIYLKLSAHETKWILKEKGLI